MNDTTRLKILLGLMEQEHTKEGEIHSYFWHLYYSEGTNPKQYTVSIEILSWLVCSVNFRLPNP